MLVQEQQKIKEKYYGKTMRYMGNAKECLQKDSKSFQNTRNDNKVCSVKKTVSPQHLPDTSKSNYTGIQQRNLLKSEYFLHTGHRFLSPLPELTTV